MSDTATKPPKTRKPNVGSDPTKGARVKLWQIGFYAFAIGLSAIMIGVSLFYILTGRFSRIFTAVAVLVTGLSWGLLTTKNDMFEEPDGIKVDNAEPELVEFVHQIAAQVEAPAPDAIYLATAAEFGITESTRYFGRKIETTVLTIGLPYLQALTKQELAALLAHELAQQADTGVAEGASALRSLRAARDLIKIERQGFINGVYGSYARKMFRSVGGVGIAQDEAADRVAAQTYGTSALVAALEKYDDIAVGFDQLLREYVVPALQNQMHPVDMFEGFGQLMKSPTRAVERTNGIERRRNKERSEFELQLTPVERAERARSWPAQPGTVSLDDGDAEAHTLLDDDAKSEKIAVGSWASKLMTNRTEPQSWQYLADHVYSAKAGSLASMVFDDEIEPDAQLKQALSWSQDQNWSSVDGPIEAGLKAIKDPEQRRTKWARCVVVEAAVASGAYSWEHSWDGSPILVDTDGESLDAIGIATMIVAGQHEEARTAFDAATE